MFDVGWSELFVIAVVAIVVIGPKDLPKLMRSFGHYAGKVRRTAAEFQRQFEEAMREAELEEVKKAIESVKTESTLDLSAPGDSPVMVANPESPPEASVPTKPKPPAKAPRKRSAAKTAKGKSPAKRSKTGTETGS
jgi:sec-independent protein translocase protein TatB